MPVPSLPPMTTRQAKRKNQKNPVKFKYTASQMRRADRIDELDERRRGLEDKDRKRKLNKRKRDEQDAKDRALQQKLLKDGKIKVEDTWGKVTASQPRLNSFFIKKTTRQDNSIDQPNGGLETDKENNSNETTPKKEFLAAKSESPKYDSQEDTLVDRSKVQDVAQGEDELTDADLLQLLSPLPAENRSGPTSPATPQRSPADQRPPTSRLTLSLPSRPKTSQSKPVLPSSPQDESPTMAKQKRKLGDASVGTDFDQQTPGKPRIHPRRRLNIHEDATAQTFTLPPPSTEITGDQEAAASFSGNRSPMRSLGPDEVYERSERLTETRIVGNGHTTEVATERASFRRQYTQEQSQNSRHNEQGLDIEADREFLQLAQDQKLEVTPPRYSHQSSPVKDIKQLREYIARTHARVERALTPTPLPQAAAAALDAEDGDMGFGDGGIDDDTLTALPDPSRFPLPSPRAEQTQSSTSFVSMDSDVFFVAEDEATGALQQPGFSTQDALNEALESVEQEAEAAAGEDVEMEDV